MTGSEKRGHFAQIPNFGFKKACNFEAVIATDLKVAMNIFTSFAILYQANSLCYSLSLPDEG